MEDCTPSFPYQPTDIDAIDHPKPHPEADNPVITTYDIHDVEDVQFIADPFLFKKKKDEWYMFFEILPKDGDGHIGRAISKDGIRWKYDRIVINSSDAGCHLSFPFVFRCEDHYYMMLDRGAKDYVPLYRSKDLLHWKEINTYLKNSPHTFRDLALIQHQDRWWLFVGTDDGRKFSGLRIYYSDKNDSIEDMNLHSHHDNPVVKNRPQAARPGGRFLVENDGRIVAFFQDCKAAYGHKIRAYEITELTKNKYSDRSLEPNPLLQPYSKSWNSKRMHHYDPWYIGKGKGWICSVDGYDYSTIKKIMKHGEGIPIVGKLIRPINKGLGKIFPSLDTRALYFSIGIYQVKDD